MLALVWVQMPAGWVDEPAKRNFTSQVADLAINDDVLVKNVIQMKG